MEEDLVSIITPLYNSERFVTEAIKSVLAQTYPHWEMLVINDGSTDKGPEIVKQYIQTDPRIHLINQKNGGSAAARNNGIGQARGRYIAFLDADDQWDANFLEEQLKLLKEKNCLLVYSAHRRIDEHGKEILRPFVPPTSVTRDELLKSCVISCLTAVYDRSVYGKIYQHEDRRIREDFVLWLDILKYCKVAYGNQHIIASYRIISSSLSHPKHKVVAQQYKVYRQVEGMNIFQSLYYLLIWAVRGYLKYRK